MADQVGLAARSTVGAWYRANLARVYLEAGRLAEAERLGQALQAGLAKIGKGRALLVTLTTLGQLRLAQNCPREAARLLANAVQEWQQSRSYGDIACLLLHAVAARRAENWPAARTSLRQAEEALAGSDFVRFKVLLHYARFELFGARAELEAAYQEIRRQAALFVDDRLKHDFLAEVALHREIEARWRQEPAGPPPQLVRLARADAPLGRPLAEAERAPVRWTVDAGQADRQILQAQGKVALRRHRLQRLLAEAQAQAAAPTDEDLARALGVSRRTILRDMAALAQTSQATPTRRRKSS
jgi:ATP/maltotriose-dependent transcriptional regulator MalT